MTGQKSLYLIPTTRLSFSKDKGHGCVAVDYHKSVKTEFHRVTKLQVV